MYDWFIPGTYSFKKEGFALKNFRRDFHDEGKSKFEYYSRRYYEQKSVAEFDSVEEFELWFKTEYFEALL